MNENFPVISQAEHFYFKGGKTGILISHGFMGTPQSMRYIGEKLAGYGYSVFAPRLEGHGTHYLDLEQRTSDDWLESLEAGYLVLRKHCTTIFVLGQSMGGTLALWLARKHRNLAGVVLVNPALEIPSYEWVRGKIEPRYLDEGEPDIKARDVHEITYSKTPIKSIQTLQGLMDKTPEILREINCPVLGFKSIEDHLVPADNTDYILEHIDSDIKQCIALKNSYHVASMDHDKDLIVSECHEFVQQQIGVKKVPNA
ncbi:alpha/beta hydrolase [Oceanobacillus massiliensis]|uniref:alpha/beta hydrolase n=1 Tax=Oceanobacillus massiliensis TaxID=1465765 RepID=UPI003019EC2B